jgi:hypothetical protein
MANYFTTEDHLIISEFFTNFLAEHGYVDIGENTNYRGNKPYITRSPSLSRIYYTLSTGVAYVDIEITPDLEVEVIYTLRTGQDDKHEIKEYYNMGDPSLLTEIKKFL